MQLQNFEHQRYDEDGYLVIHDCFTLSEIDELQRETERLLSMKGEGLVMEGDTDSPRSFNGPHLVSMKMDRLARSPRLLNAAKGLLGGDVYVHQYKINLKKAFVGDVWEWHSDYWFWKSEDGMPAPRALTAVIFLDDVTDFNGPTLFIPGSHKDELYESDHFKPYGDLNGGDNWRITTSSKLKYQLSQDYLTRSISKRGLVSGKGRKGTVLFFHCNLVHSSSLNQSPWDRRAIFISYNLVDNALESVASPRPEFLASRRFEALSEHPRWNAEFALTE